ncbi:MAG: alanine racemase [Thermoanaerobacteraceae bacterium]|nr:alanine racemase [Thermoanaerobacteraceae bacterium]
MEGDGTGRSRWLEINLQAIAHNVEQVRLWLKPGVRLMAVVKADGYGHGLVQTARVALARGAAMLGVTHPEEGVILRESGINGPVLVFRPLLPGEEETIVAYRLTASLSDVQQAGRLAAAARRARQAVRVHTKIETGMSRTGFTPEALRGHVDELLQFPELIWEGIYTHFAAATDRAFTLHQFQTFMDLVNDLERRGIRIPLRHVCNSAALLLYPEMHLDMVRAGTVLYGQLPAGMTGVSLSLQDTWSFWARIVHLLPVTRGATVGYGRTYRVRRDTVLAVVPVGYADGFGVDVTPRPAGFMDLLKVLVKTAGAFYGLPWGTCHVRINGKTAPVVGRIGMNLSCVDVGNIPEADIGMPALLPVRRTVLRESIPRVYRGLEEAKELRPMVSNLPA